MVYHIDLSSHLTNLFLRDSNTFALLEQLSINSFAGFAPSQAKQYVPVFPEGYVIRDVILFFLNDGTFPLVGHPSVHNWVQYHAKTRGANVTYERDDWSVADPHKPRKTFRCQIQDPDAP